MKKHGAKLQLLGAMGIFGTIGIFREFLPLSSGAIACLRGVLGVAFLLLLLAVRGKGLGLGDIRRNLLVLCLSGAAIGANWVLLFEAYRYSVPTATVCYYMAPLIAILASPLIGEKLSGKKLGCVAVAVAGMAFVSGLIPGGLSRSGQLMAVLFGLGAAVLYASVMLLNTRLKEIGTYDRTVVQLSVASLVVLPYVLFTGGFGLGTLDATGWVLLMVVGIVHTGAAYAMYFGAMGRLNTQTVAILSYLDPALAIVLSAVVLGQGMDAWQIIGTVMVLGSAMYSELPDKKRACVS